MVSPMIVDVLCEECGQDAREPDGRFYQIMIDSGRVERAVNVCRLCKLYHIALNERGPGMTDATKNLTRLRAIRDGVNYVVASWMKTVDDGEDLIDRRYVISLDGTITTKKDVFAGGHRDLKHLETDGWSIYQPKKKPRNTEEALSVVGSALEAQGYRREI